MAVRSRFTQGELIALHEAACRLACDAFRVSRKALRTSRARGKGKATFARQVAMYLVNLSGVSLENVGRLFDGRSKATARHALAVVEDARDDPALDAQLDALELTLHRRLKSNKNNGCNDAQDQAGQDA